MIDSRSEIHPSAKIAADVEIGPWTIIGEGVSIDSGSRVGSHVVIEGPTRIGKNNQIFQFSSIGAQSQDKKCNDKNTQLEIGDGNTIREFTSINRGTEGGGGITKIGNNNWIMAYCHIAHDCIVGNETIFSNNASLAGHVLVEDYAIISAFSGVHQFCRIGAHSFIGKASYISKDVMPFSLVAGYDPKCYGMNTVGLERRGFTPETLAKIKQAFKIIFRSGLKVPEAIAKLQALCEESPEIARCIEALQTSTRGILR